MFTAEGTNVGGTSTDGRAWGAGGGVEVPGGRPVTNFILGRQEGGGNGTIDWAREDSKVRKACKLTGSKGDEGRRWRIGCGECHITSDWQCINNLDVLDCIL